MRILHIGDFHYKSKTKSLLQATIINKLVDHLKTKEKIDFVFFSGDLVFSGKNRNDFDEAHKLLFDPFILKLNIPKENIIIAVGNHDINRDECSDAITYFFNSWENMGTNEKLNAIYVNKTKDYHSSISSSQNFYSYYKNHFSDYADVSDHLHSIHKRKIGDYNIGIVIINTAWLSTGKVEDKNNLLFPTSIIEDALTKIKECNLKILIKHHPLHYFKEFNLLSLQNIIHQNFDLMFSGHLHKEENSAVYSGNNGIYCNVTQAALSAEIGSEIGYSVVNIDLDNKENLIIDKATYLEKNNLYNDLESIEVTLPCGTEKQKQNRFRKKIVSKYTSELANANQLLLSYNTEGFNQDFLDTFTEPILSKKSRAEQTTQEDDSLIKFEHLLAGNHNYVVFGEDKCGKTSLLKRIQLNYLKNYSFNGIVPFYFDYKDFETKSNQIDLIKIIANYYEINQNDTKQLFSTGNFVFLVDNLNINTPIHDDVVAFLIDYSPRFIICSESITSRIYSTSLIDDLDFSKIFFRNLSRKEIRIYTEKSNSIKDQKQDEVIEKITNFCSQLRLPLNFWTISIILVIFKKSNDDYSKNLFSILDSCVDEMLQKRQLAFKKGGLEFDQYKEVCSQLAFYLFTKHEDTVYSARAASLITFIEDYKKKNKRIIGDSKDIFDFLIDCGILKRKDERYTFRLNGIFEYFLAYYLNDHKEYIEDILGNDSIYLSFKNELEIFSGLNRKNEELLQRIFDKTNNTITPIIKHYRDLGSIDEILINKITKARDFSREIKRLVVKTPLSKQIQDEIKDTLRPLDVESEVHLKEFVNTEQIDFELLEKYMVILSKVFKNSDRILNHNLISDIFDFLIEGYISLGYYLIDQFEDYARNENLKLSDDDLIDNVIGENILKLISNFIPILVQGMLYDGIGHENMKEIIYEKIECLLQDKQKNQYKLFLLYFLLIDIDINNRQLIDKVFGNITMNPLKVSTLLKLNYYLAFKAYKNKELEKYFRNKIQEAQLRLDSSTDIEEFQRLLSKRSKQNIVKKQIEK